MSRKKLPEWADPVVAGINKTDRMWGKETYLEWWRIIDSLLKHTKENCDLDGLIFHGTRENELKKIREDGFIAAGMQEIGSSLEMGKVEKIDVGTCFGSLKIAAYHAVFWAKYGNERPVLIVLDPKKLSKKNEMKPDQTALMMPFEKIIGRSAGEVEKEWASKEVRDWKDSLDVCGCCVVCGEIDVKDVFVIEKTTDVTRLVGKIGGYVGKDKKWMIGKSDGIIEWSVSMKDELKEFLFQKWCERAEENGREEPRDLSYSCKFSTLFFKALFGGKIEGNHGHQYNVLNGEVIDLSEDSEDVKGLKNPYYNDELFFGNVDHVKSMKSCTERVEKWVEQFLDEYDNGMRCNEGGERCLL